MASSWVENQPLWARSNLAHLNLKAELMRPFYWLPLAHKTLFSNVLASFGGQLPDVESKLGNGDIRGVHPFQAGVPLWGGVSPPEA